MNNLAYFQRRCVCAYHTRYNLITHIGKTWEHKNAISLFLAKYFNIVFGFFWHEGIEY